MIVLSGGAPMCVLGGGTRWSMCCYMMARLSAYNVEVDAGEDGMKWYL